MYISHPSWHVGKDSIISCVKRWFVPFSSPQEAVSSVISCQDQNKTKCFVLNTEISSMFKMMFQRSRASRWHSCDLQPYFSLQFLMDRCETQCGLHPPQGFDVLCVMRCFTSHWGCKEWLFDLPWISCQFKPVCPLSSLFQVISAYGTAAQWVFFVFRTALFKQNPERS